MIPIHSQLEFSKSIHAAMVRTDCKRVAEEKMTEAEAERRNEAMSSIIGTLEKQVMLAEVSEEMAAKWRERAKAVV